MPLWLFLVALSVITLVVSPVLAIGAFAAATRLWRAPFPLRKHNARPVLILIYALVLASCAEVTTEPSRPATIVGGLLAFIVTFLVIRYVTRAKWARALGIMVSYFVLYVCVSLVLATALKRTIADAYKIPTSGMAPAINPGDRIIADRTLRPRRWDIVIYRRPWEQNVVSIGRLIALPGETVQIVPPGIAINGQPLALPRDMTGVVYINRPYPGQPSQRERICNACDAPITLGLDEYFFLGDNSPQSLDGRYWEAMPNHQAGALPRDRIVGVVRIRYAPFDRFGLFR